MLFHHLSNNSLSSSRCKAAPQGFIGWFFMMLTFSSSDSNIQMYTFLVENRSFFVVLQFQTSSFDRSIVYLLRQSIKLLRFDFSLSLKLCLHFDYISILPFPKSPFHLLCPTIYTQSKKPIKTLAKRWLPRPNIMLKFRIFSIFHYPFQLWFHPFSPTPSYRS